MKYPRRGKKVTYHGRSGRPLLHKDTAGKIYIMTRKKGGGTKRVYVDTTKPNYGLAKRKPKRR
jgi:hypothetical protein